MAEERGGARWAVLASSFLTLVLVQGATFTFPVFLVPLTREWLGGVIYDLMGSYQAAFAVSIGAIVVAAGSLTAAGRMGARTEIV
jgi:hypothetical protein